MVEEALKGSISLTQQKADVSKPDNNIEVYFDVLTEHSVTLQSNVTDNYLESGTAIHDHIAHNPIIITLSGLSGELVYKPPMNFLNKIDSALDKIKIGNSPIVDKLGPIPQLLPPVDNYTQTAKEAVMLAEAAVERYKKISETFKEVAGINETRLEEIFEKLFTLWQENTALIVKTPYKTFYNMYIMACPLKQGNLNHVTDISITLKELNFQNIETTEADEDVLAKYTEVQRAQEANNGVAGTVKKSLAANIVDGTLNMPMYK